MNFRDYPEIGEIPYSCVWTARGKLIAGDDPSTTDADRSILCDVDQTGTIDIR